MQQARTLSSTIAHRTREVPLDANNRYAKHSMGVESNYTEAMVRTMLWNRAIQQGKKQAYAGTVSDIEIAKRRKKDKAQRIARRANRHA